MHNNNSELITWSNTFSCGIKIIDDQHKELVDMVNEMFKHVTGSEKEEYDYLSKVINKIVSYIKIHFATEERLMRFTKFEGFDEHKREHDNFLLTVVENILAYRSREHFTLLSFTKYLKDWILSHTAVTDKKYFDHFKSLATRKANGKLTINSSDVKHKEDTGFLIAAAGA